MTGTRTGVSVTSAGAENSNNLPPPQQPWQAYYPNPPRSSPLTDSTRQ
jgi:hypothetical protein